MSKSNSNCNFTVETQALIWQDWAKIILAGSSQDPDFLSAGNGVGDTVLGGTQERFSLKPTSGTIAFSKESYD